MHPNFLKKIPYRLMLILLVAGASLILGLLSFGGMFALWPIWPLALTAFILSVAYEGEVYWQNIKGALKKLRHPNIAQSMAETFIQHTLLTIDLNQATTPEFFKDYHHQAQLLAKLEAIPLDFAGKIQKKRVKKNLSNMTEWFIKQCSDTRKTNATPYAKSLRDWLLQAHHLPTTWEKTQQQHERSRYIALLFSISAGLFMGLGTSYLLVETFTTLPLLAALSASLWPWLIVPMALIAGTAYALLTYNALTDMIAKDTLGNWYRKLKQYWSQPLSLRTGLITLAAVILGVLSIALTIATAGTWWTIAKQARPLFAWMERLPGLIMGVINPVITGLAAIIFNLQNTSESLEMIEEALTPTSKDPDQPSPQPRFLGFITGIKRRLQKLHQDETWLQMFNPFRLLLLIALTPIRLALFLGHLISVGVTADRVPGVPQILLVFLGVFSECFEDVHYFFDHSPKDHQHANDLPTRLLTLVCTPLYFLAALWDFLGSRNHPDPQHRLSLTDAWNKQLGIKPNTKSHLEAEKLTTSIAWTQEQILLQIRQHKKQPLAEETKQGLSSLKTALKQCQNHRDITKLLAEAANNPQYNPPHFFQEQPSKTSCFLQQLSLTLEQPDIQDSNTGMTPTR